MTQPKLNKKTEIIKVYDYALENSLISKIHELKKDLYFQNIKIFFSRYIYSTNYENVQYLLSQTLNLYLLNLEFNKKILLSVYNKNTATVRERFSNVVYLKEKPQNGNKGVAPFVLFFVVFVYTYKYREVKLSKNFFTVVSPSMGFAAAAWSNKLFWKS